MMKAKLMVFLSILAILLIVSGIALDQSLTVTNYTYASDKIPGSFDGYKIAIVADTHAMDYAKGLPEVEDRVAGLEPDIIFLLGDIYDMNAVNMHAQLPVFVQNLTKIAPCVSVSGNHEHYSGDPEFITGAYKMLGVTCVENAAYTLNRSGAQISLYGLADFSLFADEKENVKHLNKYLNFVKDPQKLNILLYHRGNLLDRFNGYGFDLILSGHTHGGQIYIPFVGGLVSPELEWFPKYSGGLYNLQDGATGIVSRGIGNTKSIPRVFNRPEVLLLTLKSKA